jgi:hypothetical protein
MKYTIEKLADLEIIKVTIDGELNHLERKEIYSQTISELNRNGYNRLLFDVSRSILSSDFTNAESIKMSNYIKKFAVQKNIKLVFLGPTTSIMQTIFLMIAKAVNRGIGLRHFTNYDKATKWLCQ